MDSSTNINQMLSGNAIVVPSYQRAYSWGAEQDTSKPPKQVNQFLLDLQDYMASGSASKYYFGHFLFEEKGERLYGVIDGQQRLTTITIFIAALFRRLKQIRGETGLSGQETLYYMNLIKVDEKCNFSTVGYDNLLFKDYVINHCKADHNGLDTESKKRIVRAYDYFSEKFSEMEESELCKLLDIVANASCTTHVVKNEAEAIQMFIFQNNRGKKPSNLEIIKAQFMYNVHLYGTSENEKKELIEEIKKRFETIYKSIAEVERNIDEDDVLIYTLRIYFNSLRESNAIQRVNAELEKDTRIDFIRNFTRTLAMCFEQVAAVFDLEKNNITLHSLTILGRFGIMMPFMIKALMYRVSSEDLEKLAKALESILIRNRVIGTRADLTPRLDDVYKKFTGDIAEIVGRIRWMKKQNGWWGYWNDEEFTRALQGEIHHELAKILLWKYENYLIESGKNGYAPIRYDSIKAPQLEHIAPQTENPQSGYCEYDEDFRNQYLECLGNYLLLSGYHNISIGNIPFEAKRSTYTQLRRQQEVRDMTESDHVWNKEKIAHRKAKIIDFLMKHF